MDDKKDPKRPVHSVEPSNDADRGRGSHEVEPQKERIDDEVGSDEGTTKRQE